MSNALVAASSSSNPAADAQDEDDIKMNDISNTDIVQKYKVAAEIVNDTLKVVLAAIAPGKLIFELCQLGDDTIEAKTAKVYNKKDDNNKTVEKGLAFPTCISVNHCAGYFSPLSDDATVLVAGDVVKVDLGVHVDGYIAQAAETVVVGATVEAPLEGRAADAIAAAYASAEVALRLLKAGNTNNQITEALAKVAGAYKCKHVEGVLSHQLKRFIIDGPKVILGKADAETQVDDAKFEAGEVYSFDVLISSGEGTTKETDTRTTVFRRNVEVTYGLKMKASRSLFSEANKKFPTLPFPLRALDEDRKGRLGIAECVNHNLFTAFPVLYEKSGEFIAQVKFTVLLMASGTQKITHFAAPANAKSSLKIEDPDLVALLATSAAPKKKKNNKKKATASSATGAAAAADASADAEGDDE